EAQVREAAKELYQRGELPTNVAPQLVDRQKAALTQAERYQVTRGMFDKTGAIVEKEITKRQKMFPVKVVAARPWALVVYAENMTSVELWLYRGKESLKSDQGDHFSAMVAYRAGSDAQAQIYVTAPDEDTTLTFFVYGWGVSPSS